MDWYISVQSTKDRESGKSSTVVWTSLYAQCHLFETRVTPYEPETLAAYLNSACVCNQCGGIYIFCVKKASPASWKELSLEPDNRALSLKSSFPFSFCYGSIKLDQTRTLQDFLHLTPKPASCWGLEMAPLTLPIPPATLTWIKQKVPVGSSCCPQRGQGFTQAWPYPDLDWAVKAQAT